MALLLTRLRGLLVQSLAMIVFPMVIMLVLVAYGGISLHEHAMRSLVGERDARAVRAAATTLADRFVQRRLALQMLAEQLADGASFEHALADNPELRRVFDGGLVVANRQREVLASWQPGAPWAADLRATDTPWVFEHEATVPLVVANTTSANGELMLFGGLSLDSLNVPGALGVIQDDPQTRLILIDGDGHVIEDSAGESVGQEARTVPALASYLAEEEANANRMPGEQHSDTVTVSATIEGLGWMLITQEAWTEVVSPALRLSLVAPLAVIPAILLALGVLWFGIVRVVNPLRHLGRAATALAWGDYAALRQPVGGVQEIGELQRSLNQMAQRVQQAHAGMHSYIGAMLCGQEEERKRIARDLHDDTLQSLIVLDQCRQKVQRTLERDPQGAAVQLTEMRTMVEQMIANLRRVIRDMRPTYIEDLGLAPALEMLCTQNADSAQAQLAFTATGMSRRLPTEQEMGLYRIAQEAVANALRHAAATHVDIELDYGDGTRLSIRDDGRGFAVPARPEAFAQAAHYGLMGMVERAEQMGAQFHIDSEPGKGTRIHVALPMR